jgi:hypothetical protein
MNWPPLGVAWCIVLYSDEFKLDFWRLLKHMGFGRGEILCGSNDCVEMRIHGSASDGVCAFSDPKHWLFVGMISFLRLAVA